MQLLLNLNDQVFKETNIIFGVYLHTFEILQVVSHFFYINE